MKKLAFIIALLAMVAMAEAQTGTIVDNGTFITFNYSDGDTVNLGKENIVLVKDSNDEVFIMTSHQWRSDRVTRIVQLDPDEFGYSSAGSLRDYLAAISFKAYREVIVYDETTNNLDTIHYYYGDELQYSVVLGYDDAFRVISKTIINP